VRAGTSARHENDDWFRTREHEWLNRRPGDDEGDRVRAGTSAHERKRKRETTKVGFELGGGEPCRRPGERTARWLLLVRAGTSARRRKGNEQPDGCLLERGDEGRTNSPMAASRNDGGEGCGARPAGDNRTCDAHPCRRGSRALARDALQTPPRSCSAREMARKR
jgi:hypothetical protein